MHYNLAQLLKEPTGSTRDYEVDESFTGPEDGSDRAQGWVKVIRTHHGVLVRAKLDLRVKLSCSRCISQFEYGSELTMEEECFATIDPETGRKVDPPEEADGVAHLDAQHGLDMSEFVRQYAITEVPIKPLCRDKCLGLCTECGANLNEEKCKCEASSIDTRWESLAELLTERLE